MPRTAKKKRDPAKPKKAQSAYQYFCHENRERVRAEHPEAKNTEMFGLLSAEWANVTPETRTRFEAMAYQDKLRYDRAMAQYVPSPGFEAGASGRGKKRSPEERGPKRALNAYQLYSRDHRARILALHPDAKHTEVFGLLSAEWAKASPEERAKYQAEAAIHREQYKRDRAAWEAANPELANSKRSRGNGRKRRPKHPDAPKRPMSAYQLYSKVHRERVAAANPDAKHTEMFALLSAEWKAAPEPERQMYIKQSEDLRAQYKIDMAKFKAENPEFS